MNFWSKPGINFLGHVCLSLNFSLVCNGECLVHLCVNMCMCSLGLVSVHARLDVDALHVQDCGSRKDWRAVVNDTFWRTQECL